MFRLRPQIEIHSLTSARPGPRYASVLNPDRPTQFGFSMLAALMLATNCLAAQPRYEHRVASMAGPASPCSPSGNTQTVLLVEPSPPIDGWPQSRLDDLGRSIASAVAVWNEEGLSARRLVYAGRFTNQVPTANTIFVSLDDNSQCVSMGTNQVGSRLATAFNSQAGAADCFGPREIQIHLRQCPNATTMLPGFPLLQFTSFWPSNYGDVNLENLLVHELGHAAFGFDDYPYDLGVMSGSTDTSEGSAASSMFLRRIDQQTAVHGLLGSPDPTPPGTAGGVAVARVVHADNLAAGWYSPTLPLSAISPPGSPTLATTLGPGIDLFST